VEKILENIKSLAKSKGVSITQVEKECGIGKNSVYRWDKCSPSVDSVKRVADYFGVAIDELVNGGDDGEGERNVSSGT
jgi:transcriptional regulator with XRE-family HTH domain